MHEDKLTSKNLKAFSSVEIILAIVLLGLTVLAIASSLSFGIFSQSQANQEAKANFLLEEGVEAVSNIKDSAFTNLVNGTYGLSISGGNWVFLGSSDTVDGYTRNVQVSTIDTNTRQVVVTVSWTANGGLPRSINVTQRFTDWERVIAPPLSWSTPSAQSTIDISGTTDGILVETLGNFAYVVRSGSSSNFTVFDITNLSSPIQLGTISVSGTRTDIEVSGTNVYLSGTDNSQELIIVNVSNPSSLSFTNITNLPGNADANGLDVVGNRLYIVRATSSDPELVVYDITNPSAPTLLGSIQDPNTLSKIIVDGSYAYIASSANSGELTIYNISNPASITFTSGLDLSSSTDGTRLAWYGSRIAVVQGAFIRLVNVANPLAPALLGSYVAGTTATWISGDATNNYIFFTASGSPHFRVINVTNPLSPTVLGSQTYGGTLTNVYYDSVLNRAFVTGNGDFSEFIIYRPN